MRNVPFAGLILAAFSLPMAAQITTTPNTVVSVCVGTLTGIIREVPNANYCIKGLETFQQFNSTGVQGATGAQGPAGPMGLQGVQGGQGTQGPAGPAGVAGPAGPQGQVGLTGSAGATGAQGPAGTTGAAGPQGTPGMAGSTGAIGPQGAPGVAGATGAAGPQGTAGATGAIGPQGVAGATGSQGVAGATGSQGVAGATGAQGSIGLTGATGAVGPQGVAGSAGATGAQGIAGATGSQGVAGRAGVNYRGNFSSSTTYSPGDVVLYNNALYEETTGPGTAVAGVLPSTSGTYTLFLPAGATGAMGAMGATGATGPAGPNGATGPAGQGSSLTYTIHYYQNVFTITGAPLGGSDVNNDQESCPAPEIPVAASCGYQYPVGNTTLDQHDIIVNYVGMGYGNDVTVAPTQSSCLFTNTSTASRNILTGVSCLAAVSTTKTNALPAVVKSCTYDPDTQSPCTAADAIAATEVHPGVFQGAAGSASANLSQSASASAPTAASQNNGDPKVKKSVTLWFRE